MATTWDPSHTNAHIILSNGNLTATNDSTINTNFSGRTAAVISAAAKIYWEMHVDQDNASSIGGGLALLSETFADNVWIGSDTVSVGCYTDGNCYSNGSIVSGGGGICACTTGATMCFAVIGGSKLWVRVNGGNWNNDVIANQNPATNTGGVSISALGFTGDTYPAMNTLNIDGVQPVGKLTGNFGATALAFTAPSGFSTFDGTDVLMAQAVM